MHSGIYLALYLIIVMFLLVLTTWIYLAKLGFVGDMKFEKEGSEPPKIGLWSRFLTSISYFLLANTVLSAMAFIGTVFFNFDSCFTSPWDQLNRHLIMVLHFGIIIILNGIFAVVFRKFPPVRKRHGFAVMCSLIVAGSHALIAIPAGLYGRVL